MNTDSRWKYIFLGVGAFLVVIVIVYFRVASYFHVSVASLLPSGPRPILIHTASTLPKEEPAPAPVQRFTTANGEAVYVITGRFVTAPAYNAQHLLQGDFVIDKDPLKHKIPVVMISKTDKISVGTSTDSFTGKTTVASETGEQVKSGIVVNSWVQLRVYPLGATKSADYIVEQKVMDNILAGNWSIPDGFVLHPSSLGFIVFSK
jgi:hypothetical protein